MKTKIKTLLLLLLQTLFLAQPSQGTDLSVPAAKNSVKTTIPLTGVTDATLLNTNNSLTTIAYTDGLGRTNMTAQKAVTPTRQDLVTVTNYDCYGRVSNQWLPTPVNGTSIPDPNAVIQQAVTSYGDNMPYTTITRTTDLGSADAGTYGQSTQVCRPGAAWHNGNKTLNQKLTSNESDNPQLIIRQYGVSGDLVVLYDDRFQAFVANVKQTTDEDGHVSYTFTDAGGRTLLQRTVDGGENYDTYSVYDDMGHLRFVLSPEASDRMSTAGTYSLTGINTDNNPLAQYAYAYKYDEKGRCIAKKLPGKDWINLMYDMADHLVFSQDGNQRATNQWTYYKYDILDRLIQSGTTIITDASAMQNTYNSTTAVETYVAGTGYTSSCQLGTNTLLLTQNFYDTYDFLNLSAYSAYKSTLSFSTSSPVGYDAKYSNVVDGVDIATQGLLTGTTVAMLDNSVTIVTARYYDDKGRVVRSLTHSGLGLDRDYYNYSFSGKVLRKFELHYTSFDITNIATVYTCKYDFADRLTDIWHKSDVRTDSVRLCSIQYDEMGRPIQKILHGGLQSISYTYNIQNQLKSITSPLFAETLYYQDGQGGKPTYFNGDIGSVSWGTVGAQNKQYDFHYDGLNRMTQATYSPNGNYSENVGMYDKNSNIVYLERNGCYDLSSFGGSIVEGFTIDAISNTYKGNQLLKSQDSADNQSLVLAKNDFKDDDNTLAAEYLYDNNGNMIADANKGIALIKYNLLNLPEKVYFMNGNKIEYQYDATGVKHKAKYTTALNPLQVPLGQAIDNPSNNVLEKDSVEYSFGYIYKNRKIDKILTPEGYIQTNGVYNNWNYWKYCYLLKDHQGNTRVNLSSDYVMNHSTTTYTASGQIDYYPFGMEITPPSGTNSGTNPYLYSGKEIDRMHGLNEYDFSARWQDAAVPGFTTPDPLAENHYSDSPYSYCSGDPVNRIDPTGMDDDNPDPDSDDYYFPDYSNPDPDDAKNSDGSRFYDHLGGASVTADNGKANREATYNAYCPAGGNQDNSGISNNGSGGNSNQNLINGQSAQNGRNGSNTGLIGSILTLVSKVDDAISSSAVTKNIINSMTKTNFTLPQTMNTIGKYTNPLAVGISLDNVYKNPTPYNVFIATGNVSVIALGFFTGVEEWSLAWSAATIGSEVVNNAFNK